MVNTFEPMWYCQWGLTVAAKRKGLSQCSACGDQLVMSAISTGRESNGTNIIHLYALLGLFYTLRTRDLPRLTAQVHTWAELNSFAAPCCLLRIKTECSQSHDYTIPGYPQQTWTLASVARMHTASQTVHLIQFIIMTACECPRITPKMWNKIIYTQRILLKKMSLWQKAFGGLNHCTLSVISQGLLVMQFYIWPLEETKNNYVSLQSRYFTYCYWIEGGWTKFGFSSSSLCWSPPPFRGSPPCKSKETALYFSSVTLWFYNLMLNL